MLKQKNKQNEKIKMSLLLGNYFLLECWYLMWTWKKYRHLKEKKFNFNFHKFSWLETTRIYLMVKYKGKLYQADVPTLANIAFRNFVKEKQYVVPSLHPPPFKNGKYFGKVTFFLYNKISKHDPVTHCYSKSSKKKN